MIELLAPAGSREALTAAIENGADAVYLAGNLFGARAYADNFDRENLREAIQFAHLRGVAIHITVNTIVGDNEMEELADYLRFLYEAGADAILVQDLGVARVAKSVVPDLPMHASTQMTVHNLEGVLALADMGFSRVVLSREMSLNEIREICRKSPVEIECFAHGALCVCYSGQCLMSSMIGGRSGNRGRCAQPCRLPYTLVNDEGNDVLGDSAGNYLLSPRDMNTIDILPELIQAGVASLKIEGRMKRPEYVSVVVSTYRKELDRIYGIEKSSDKEESHRRLAQIFNRDFTTGFLLNNPGKNLMSDRRPNNRGLLIGRVTKYDFSSKRVFVKLSADVTEGDELDFWVKVGGRVTTALTDIKDEKGHSVTEGKAGEEISFPLAKTVKVHDRVFRVYDAKLMQEARSTFQNGAPVRRIPVDCSVTARIGKPVVVSFRTADGAEAEIVSDFICEKAQKTPVSVEVLQKQLSRLGTTVYELRNFAAELDDNAIVPVSVLNNLRRQASEILDGKRLEKYKRVSLSETGAVKSLPACDIRKNREKSAKLVVRVDSVAKAKAAVDAGADGIIFGGDSYSHHVFSLKEYSDVFEYAKKYNRTVDFNTPRILRAAAAEKMQKMMQEWEKIGADTVLVHNIGSLYMAQKTGLPVQSDFSLISYNEQTIQHLKELGVVRATLSPELNLQQVASIAEKAPLPLECIVYGRLELMVSAYCVLGSFLGNVDSGACSAPCMRGGFKLTDRMGAEFPVVNDADCNMHILNSKILSMLPHAMKFAKMGVERLRIDGAYLNEEEIRRSVTIFRDFMKYNEELTEDQQIRCDSFEGQSFTRGHYFRGVL